MQFHHRIIKAIRYRIASLLLPGLMTHKPIRIKGPQAIRRFEATTHKAIR